MMQVAPPITPNPIVLRPYQADALEKVAESDKVRQSCLVTSPTGTGKTVMFSQLAESDAKANGRVLIIVDRDELVRQTADAIYNMTGIVADIEQAGSYANEHYQMLKKPVVIATIQTISRHQRSLGNYRYTRFNPSEFTRIILDEAHLTITTTYKRTVKYFTDNNPNIKVVGFTATPMRLDGRSLAQLYEASVFEYSIMDAIDDGWLVPVFGKQVAVDSLDLSSLPAKGKRDWSPEEIGSLMEQNETIFSTVGTLATEALNRPTLVFCARVAHAEMMAAALNDQIGRQCARFISGDTPEDERRRIIGDFRDGRINYLTNCAVLTTGFDAPVVEVVAMCRPTKSKSLFAQCVGRGTRPLPGLVDGVEEASDRRDAILGSKKPQLDVLSFVGRHGGVDLSGPEDVLAGDMEDPAVVKRAKEMADEGSSASVAERLEQAKVEIANDRARLLVQADYRLRTDDLFNKGASGGMQMNAEGMATQGQLRVLMSAGVEDSMLRKLKYDKSMAGYLAAEITRRRIKGLATYKQCRKLKQLGYDKASYKDMSVAQATALIDRVAANGWKRVPL